MSKVTMPDPVAYREWSTKYRCWEVSDKDDLPAGADTEKMEPLCLLSDAEAYADARVREALSLAVSLCEKKYRIRSEGGFTREASTARALAEEIRSILENNQ